MRATCAVCGPVEVRQKMDANVGRYIYQCREKRRQERREAERRRPSRPQRRPRAKLGPTCERCGFVPEDPCQLQVDHITPKWKGGTDRRDNLQTLCANCHCLKTKSDKAEWMASPAGQAWRAKVQAP